MTSSPSAPAEAELEALRSRVANLEAELGVAQARNEAYFSRSLALFAIAGFDGYFKHINPLWSHLLGWSEPELQARPVIDFVHPDDREATVAMVAGLRANASEVVAFDHRFRCKAGNYRWLRWNATSDLERGLILAAAHDLTDTRAAEERLREQNELMELILSSMTDGVIAVDDSGDARVYNPAAERVFGPLVREAGENEWAGAYGNFLADTVTPFPSERLPMVRALGGEESADVEMFVRHARAPQGLWIAASGRPLRGSDGIVRGAVVVCRDVTERRWAEEKLRSSEARFRDIAMNIPGGVFQFTVRDGLWVMEYVSERMGEIVGVPAAEIARDVQNLIERIHPEDRAAYTASVEQAVASLTPWHFEGRILRPDGEVRWCQGDAKPARDLRGDVIFPGVLFDSTERKSIEEARRQSSMQEEIIRAQDAALAELSTPLIPITDSVVVMPLIGSVDSRRAQQVIETLLEGIGRTRAQTAILDITGVPLVDTQVANALIRAAQAARLLGAAVVLTGIRPEVAQTLVGLGVDLSGITTRSSLQSGIATAIKIR